MSDKEKEFGEVERESDEIVEETMREIYDELYAKEVDETSPKENETSAEEDETPDEEVDEDREDADSDDIYDDDDSDDGESDAEDDDEIDDDEEYDEDDDEDPLQAVENDPRVKKHRKKKKIAIVIASIIGVLALAYVGVSIFFMSHFFYNTKINGTNFSMDSAEQVESHMKKQVEDYALTLKESDGQTESISGKDIDLTYASGDSVEKLLKKQNPFLWITALWNAPDITSTIGVKYDEAKLTSVVGALNCMKPENQVAPVSATPEFQGTEFVVKDEVIGSQIDSEKFQTAVNTAIEGFQSELDMQANNCYVAPKYTKDSQEVTAAKDAMNAYLKANITYDFNPYTEVVDASVISTWLTVDGDMNVTFNTDAVTAYIQGLADKYNTYGTTRTFTGGYGNTAEVSGGNYGWAIDKETEYNALVANIQNGETVTREPNYSQRAVSHEGNDFGNTYVEVDLSNQHMFMFQDGACVLDSPIVTGNPQEGNATPQGTYYLAYKTTNTVLRGKALPGGGYEWESPVSYWMPFNGGIGLHDATWRSSFGGSIYNGGGSHGCVNLPYSAAASLYNYVDAGTPVVCHY